MFAKKIQHARSLESSADMIQTIAGKFIDNSGKCPVCNQVFHTRLRTLQHVLEKRVRAKSNRLSCRSVLMSGSFPKVPAAQLEIFRAADKLALRACKRNGKSKVPVTIHAKRKLAAPIIPERPRKRIRGKCTPVDHPGSFWWKAQESPRFLFTVGNGKRVRLSFD